MIAEIDPHAKTTTRAVCRRGRIARRVHGRPSLQRRPIRPPPPLGHLRSWQPLPGEHREAGGHEEAQPLVLAFPGLPAPREAMGHFREASRDHARDGPLAWPRAPGELGSPPSRDRDDQNARALECRSGCSDEDSAATPLRCSGEALHNAEHRLVPSNQSVNSLPELLAHRWAPAQPPVDQPGAFENDEAEATRR